MLTQIIHLYLQRTLFEWMGSVLVSSNVKWYVQLVLKRKVPRGKVERSLGRLDIYGLNPAI
jgi:hypothetical protein